MVARPAREASAAAGRGPGGLNEVDGPGGQDKSATGAIVIPKASNPSGLPCTRRPSGCVRRVASINHSGIVGPVAIGPG